MLSLDTAKQLLNLGKRLGDESRANEQLKGAVALYNMLNKQNVAYLADEVGMGKTYVALSVMALFRHYSKTFRVCVIAPRQNIQEKWIKELKNFTLHNINYPDLKNQSINKKPVRQIRKCDSLIELLQEAAVDDSQDFFLRLTSFSLGYFDKNGSKSSIKDDLMNELPWLTSNNNELFDLRNREEFKKNFACALCCALPVFDLLIVDEGHNLKHGRNGKSDRNKVMSIAFGNSLEPVDKSIFPNYGPRAKRVLFLSATPVEDTYIHLYNQLDMFGLGEKYPELKINDSEQEEVNKNIIRQFLIRRVTNIQVGDKILTKNLYRQEWRAGGLKSPNEPCHLDDPKQKLIVALVQKKVAEILGSDKFNKSFQIGMLASFESFLETAKVKNKNDEIQVFDDSDQTDSDREREGIDVNDLNSISRSYRKRFPKEEELPHPKMDALVNRLSYSWITGKKSLIFVRRVASVNDIKRKLDVKYNNWLYNQLLLKLPSFKKEIEVLYDNYHKERDDFYKRRKEEEEKEVLNPDIHKKRKEDDKGGFDTFFAWYFRGEGPSNIISGANLQRRFTNKGGIYSTYFELNYISLLFQINPRENWNKLISVMKLEEDLLKKELVKASKKYLSNSDKIQRADLFEAFQAAAIELLKDSNNSFQDKARIIWNERFKDTVWAQERILTPSFDIQWINMITFWTELESHPTLYKKLLPINMNNEDYREYLRDIEQRIQLIASTCRLGHSLIDLYTLFINRLGTMKLRARESSNEDNGSGQAQIQSFIELLELQMNNKESSSLGDKYEWGAFDEIEAIAKNHNLIIDVNFPLARDSSLIEMKQEYSRILGSQQPVSGMSGQVNKTIVSKFRMPGYPFVLISTDLLQEGEDLHTFCADVYHYGISWTPSSMEQRIGRIDRVHSLTDRVINEKGGISSNEYKLQVYYPYLKDTYEILQVRKVLNRMNIFMKLMHEGLTFNTVSQNKLNVNEEALNSLEFIEPIAGVIKSSFDIKESMLGSNTEILSNSRLTYIDHLERFRLLKKIKINNKKVVWEEDIEVDRLLGTVQLANRKQPFTLLLLAYNSIMVVRCISPVGKIDRESFEQVKIISSKKHIKIGVVNTDDENSYNITVEGDALLIDKNHDIVRSTLLIRKIIEDADYIEDKILKTDQEMNIFKEDLFKEGSDDK